MWIGVIPVVMAFGTIALILAEYTSVFTILGKPFEPILSVLGIPEAADAAQLMVVGFTDMFLPVILANGLITSELTLFVVATVSVTQLIFMAEVGGLASRFENSGELFGLSCYFPIAYTNFIANYRRSCTSIILMKYEKTSQMIARSFCFRNLFRLISYLIFSFASISTVILSKS